MTIFLWFLASISIMFFCTFFLYPFLRQKIMYKKYSKKVMRMSKNPKYSDETKELLEELAKQLKEESDNTKL